MDDDIRNDIHIDRNDARPLYPGFHPQYSNPHRGGKVFAAALGVLALCGLGYFAWTQHRSSPPAKPVDTAASASAAVAPIAPAASALAPAASASVVQHPINTEATAPTRSGAAASQDPDALLRNALIDTLGAKALNTWLQTDGFARRVVATVDNLGREHATPRLWPVLPISGRFTAQGQNDAAQIAAGNAARYSSFVAFASSIDAARAAAMYRQHYPQFQAAYRELGFGERYFNDRLVEVIDLLLATPEPSEPVALRLVEVKGPDGQVMLTAQPWLRYEFADPALQALPAGQKMLLRLGAEHRSRLKAQLQAFRAEVALAATPSKQ
jgi:Protein of unknown function (DUF3014)